MLGKLPHWALSALSEKYGPLMFLYLGYILTMVVSSTNMTKEHDLIFASKPTIISFKYMLYNADMGLTPYEHYWRQICKVCVLTLQYQIESLHFVREEVNLMIQYILEHSVKYRSNIHVNVSKIISGVSTNIIYRMAFGRKYSFEAFDNRGFKVVIQEYFYLLVAFDIGDSVHSLAWMNL
eukprot:Gb_32851 [translate_table: standard]